ncbi:hypothetical protein JCM9492_00130 [Aquifex pyrophilus]
MGIPRKPLKDADEFIKTAKAEDKENQQGKEVPKVKKFLIELPYDLWMKLKMKAIQEGKPLKDVILEILTKEANKM